MNFSPRRTLLLLAALSTTAAVAHAQPARGPQRLFTQFRGPGMSLDVINGGPEDNQIQLAAAGNFTGQQWTMLPLPGGFVSLTTAFRGPRMCLDVVNGGPRDNHAELRRCGNFTGQFWSIVPYTP